MYQRVVVALDGSPVAEGILPFIEQIAGPLDIEVILLHVAKAVGAEAPIIADLNAQGYLEPLVGSLKAKGVRAGARVRIGDPATEIVEAAEELKADLIAMTTHGRTGLGRLLFGSVAEAVLRASPTPVFLMRMREAALASAA